MLVIKDKPGQLCNRLWSFSPFISDAIDREYEIKILHFYDYFEYYQNLESFENVTFSNEENSELSKHFKLYKIITDFFIGKKICVSKINLKKIFLIISSWRHVKPKKIENKEALRILFLPKKEHVQKVENTFKEKRENSEIIIGVHIRRGDYKNYKKGKYFYSDFQYAQVMGRLSNQFGKEKKVSFLLCSNSKVDLINYNKFSVFQIENPNLIEDLYALSKCDYIIGPPSTYSMWASFYGDAPLCFIEKPNENHSLLDFSIIVSQNKFASGKIYK